MPRVIRKQFLYIACVLVVIGFHSVPPSTYAQSKVDAKTAAANEAVNNAAKQGLPLKVSSTDVTGNVSAEAVLIPAKIAKTVFGKEVANNYAVIALTISNRSSDDSLIVHSIFIDYSLWLLSGSSPFPQKDLLCPEGSSQKEQRGPRATTQATPASAGQPANGTQGLPCPGNPLQRWQAQTQPNQIDSIETRIVRGQLLDRQPWTTRNWVLRALQAVGSVATAFTFVTSSQSWIKGIGAYNGQGIPAAQTFWPDATVGQMNRISDFGFSVNKVVAKQSSEIVVAFFPIDRFISPELKSLFISSPSVFFAPFVMAADVKIKDRLKDYISYVAPPTNVDNLKAHLYEVTSGGCLQVEVSKTAAAPDKSLELACQTADLLDRLSLNTVRVIVSGTMTVDVNKVPPQITSVEINPPANVKAEDMWKGKGPFTGTIHGSFLGGATPTIVNAEASKIATVKRLEEGSTETALHFTLSLSEVLPKEVDKLTFQVSKPSSEGATIKSATSDYLIQTPQ